MFYNFVERSNNMVSISHNILNNLSLISNIATIYYNYVYKYYIIYTTRASKYIVTYKTKKHVLIQNVYFGFNTYFSFSIT